MNELTAPKIAAGDLLTMDEQKWGDISKEMKALQKAQPNSAHPVMMYDLMCEVASQMIQVDDASRQGYADGAQAVDEEHRETAATQPFTRNDLELALIRHLANNLAELDTTKILTLSTNITKEVFDGTT